MFKSALITIIFCFISQSLFAHGSHGTGIMAGFTHPIFGLDHLLAISCLGSIIPLLKDQKAWIVAVAFTVTMAVSGALGIGTEGFMHMENGIALSVVLLGLALALNIKLPTIPFTIAGVLIAFFHGYAHGVEMPETSSASVYISGYTLGVILIFLVSFVIASLLIKQSKSIGVNVLRIIGLFITCLGLYILFG